MTEFTPNQPTDDILDDPYGIENSSTSGGVRRAPRRGSGPSRGTSRIFFRVSNTASAVDARRACRRGRASRAVDAPEG